jgi:Virulence-associated protein E
MMKPKTLSSDLAHLPPALTPLVELRHWVLWRWEFRKGIWTKPPFMATASGEHAKSDDPDTWSSYQTALAGLSNGGGFDGIGFVLLGTAFDVVDLDHCLDSESGQPDPWARNWLDTAVGSYVERTPSGEGLRIISGGVASAKLARRWSIGGAREKAGIEVYRNCKRYITVTGAQVGDCHELASVDLLERIRSYYDRDDAGRDDAGHDKKDHSEEGAGNGFDFNNASTGGGGSMDYDAVIRDGAPVGQRSELFQACVWHLASKHMPVDAIVSELAKYPNGIAAKYITDGRLRSEVERSYRKWKNSRTPAPPTGTSSTGGQEPEDPLIWELTDKNGFPRPSCANARRALMLLGVQCRYDEFHDKYLVEGKAVVQVSNLDHAIADLRRKIHLTYHFDPGDVHMHHAVNQLCIKNKFNPVRDYLDALCWDGVPRLDRWMITYLGAEDTALNREFGRLVLIAATRRVRHPGTKFDPIVVLEGLMGTQKSKAIETMAGIENFSDQTILGARDREQQELLAGVWLFEIAELSNMRKTEVEHIKAFASRTHDRARPVYGRTRVDRPRTCVLIATTNDDQYLKAHDRRFWPIKTAVIDIEALRRDRDQLWAEAAQREAECISIVLRHELWAPARVAQEAREEHDPWDDTLGEAIGTVTEGEERVSSRDLLETVLKFQPSRLLDRDSKRLGRCMRRLGWDGPKTLRIDQKQAKGFSRRRL